MLIEDVEVGMLVRFHPIIGGKHDGNLYRIRKVAPLDGVPYVWLQGIAGFVDPRAISRVVPGADNFGMPKSGAARQAQAG